MRKMILALLAACIFLTSCGSSAKLTNPEQYAYAEPYRKSKAPVNKTPIEAQIKDQDGNVVKTEKYTESKPYSFKDLNELGTRPTLFYQIGEDGEMTLVHQKKYKYDDKNRVIMSTTFNVGDDQKAVEASHVTYTYDRDKKYTEIGYVRNQGEDTALYHITYYYDENGFPEHAEYYQQTELIAKIFYHCNTNGDIVREEAVREADNGLVSVIYHEYTDFGEESRTLTLDYAAKQITEVLYQYDEKDLLSGSETKIYEFTDTKEKGDLINKESKEYLYEARRKS